MFAFSPDAIVNNEELLEVKCPVAGQSVRGPELFSRLKYLKKEKDVFTLRKTHTYYTQIQFGLSILNLRTAKFLVYYKNGSDEGVHEFRVERDDEFCDTMLTRLKYRYLVFILPYLVAHKNRLLISKQ